MRAPRGWLRPGPRGVAAAVLLALALWLPRAASACAACFSGSARSRSAFFHATVFLSLLPLAAFGLFAWWFLRHGLERLRAEFSESDSWVPPA